jgi:F-type H+-transporting ATPase subunit alpha
MKKIAGPLRVELAQFRELEAFAQFGSDLSKDTLERLNHGKRIVEVLKQPQYAPMTVEKQVLLLYVLTHKGFSAVDVDKVQEAEAKFFEFIAERYSSLLTEIREKKEITAELEAKIKAAAAEFTSKL